MTDCVRSNKATRQFNLIFASLFLFTLCHLRSSLRPPALNRRTVSRAHFALATTAISGAQTIEGGDHPIYFVELFGETILLLIQGFSSSLQHLFQRHVLPPGGLGFRRGTILSHVQGPFLQNRTCHHNQTFTCLGASYCQRFR